MRIRVEESLNSYGLFPAPRGGLLDLPFEGGHLGGLAPGYFDFAVECPVSQELLPDYIREKNS